MIQNEFLAYKSDIVSLSTQLSLKTHNNKNKQPELVPYNTSGQFIITNYRIIFQTPSCSLLLVPLRQIRSIKINENSTTFLFLSPLQFNIQGQINRGIAIIYGFLTPEKTKYQIFWQFKLNSTIQQKNFSNPDQVPLIYSQYYQRIFKDKQLYKITSGRFLFDPFMEFSRQGVKISVPSYEQLAIMIFGLIIDQHLLAFLLKNKPKYTELSYQQTQQTLILKNQFILNPIIELQPIQTDFSYDPRSLFDDDEQFYDLLEAHPQNTKDFLTQYQQSQEDLKAQLEEDEKLSEEISESQPQLISQAKSIFKNIKNAVKSQLQPAQPQKPTQPAQQLQIEAQNYAHGMFFKKTFFMISPIQRATLVSFIHLKPPHFDTQHTQLLRNEMRISYCNAAYQHSPTYPAIIAVPSSISDAQLISAMKFRSRGRACVLSYSAESATLSRSAQPGAGFGISREADDQALLKAISVPSEKIPSQNSLSQQDKSEETANKQTVKSLIVFDARPKLSAFANVLSGKGFESKSAYPFAETYYCGIQNIHAIRDSFEQVLKGIYEWSCGRESWQDMKDFTRIGQIIAQDGAKSEILKVFYNSKWIEHLQLILFSSVSISQMIVQQHKSVMVHCSDGWDRTSQLTSLSMLLMDGYYRTLKGFLILIQKEWLSFGHMFATRNKQVISMKASKRKDKEFFDYHVQEGCKQMEKTNLNCYESNDPQFQPLPQSQFRYSNSQASPIFFQFLDSVYQVLMQNSTKFEFTSELLTFLASAVQNGLYGDFQGDNEAMRVENMIYQATNSCFDYCVQNPQKFMNPVYKAVDLEQDKDFITCSWCSKDLSVFWELWKNY